jgi:hypothetical protein
VATAGRRAHRPPQRMARGCRLAGAGRRRRSAGPAGQRRLRERRHGVSTARRRIDQGPGAGRPVPGRAGPAAEPGRNLAGRQPPARLPRLRPPAGPDRFRLPGRARRRLRHPPHDPRPRGGRSPRPPAGRAARPSGHRKRHHQRRSGTGRHLRRLERAPGHLDGGARGAGCGWGAAGHLRGPPGAGARARAGRRTSDLVAEPASPRPSAPAARLPPEGPAAAAGNGRRVIGPRPDAIRHPHHRS